MRPSPVGGVPVDYYSTSRDDGDLGSQDPR